MKETKKRFKEAMESEEGFAKTPSLKGPVEEVGVEPSVAKSAILKDLETRIIDIDKLVPIIKEDRELALADFKAGRKSMTDLPVLIRKEPKKDGTFVILDGNSRILEAQAAGKTTIPITTDEKTYIQILKEREAAPLIAEARKFKTADEFVKAQEEIALNKFQLEIKTWR